jgi:uncharacterized protein YgiM (DUF1202 family)
MKGHRIDYQRVGRAISRWRRNAVARFAEALLIMLALTLSSPAFGQTSVGSPHMLPSTTIAPAPSGGEAGPPAELPPPPPPAHHHAVAHAHVNTSSSSSSNAVEPAKATVKLKEDAWAYSKPAKSSKTIERVHAGKFVNVTGSTRYYVQVKLKSGATGYVPASAVELTRPADKVFKLTKDAGVLSEPSRYGKKLAEVHSGHDVHVVGTALNYMKVRMKDGLEGYVPITALE